MTCKSEEVIGKDHVLGRVAQNMNIKYLFAARKSGGSTLRQLLEEV